MIPFSLFNLADRLARWACGRRPMGSSSGAGDIGLAWGQPVGVVWRMRRCNASACAVIGSTRQVSAGFAVYSAAQYVRCEA